jgi:hypothetical protein
VVTKREKVLYLKEQRRLKGPGARGGIGQTQGEAGFCHPKLAEISPVGKVFRKREISIIGKK